MEYHEFDANAIPVTKGIPVSKSGFFQTAEKY